MSTQIIIASAIASNLDENNAANTVGGERGFYGCPVVGGLSGGISRRYEGIRFVRAEGVEINALQGAFVVEGSGVEAGGAEALTVRLAETRLVRSSRTGLTSWPALVEEGWVPGFRADQIPNPAELRGLTRFVVFPADSTGHSDWKAEPVEVEAWAEAVAAWESWRGQEGPLPASTEGVWRLARNHTRRTGGWWTAQEVRDLLRHAGDAVMEDHGDEGLLFWSQSRCICGWASSRILDPGSGEVAETWPLGLRTLPESFKYSPQLEVACLQIIDGKLHWKFVNEEGVGLYVDAHDYTVWNGSPRPPFSDKEWLGEIDAAMGLQRPRGFERTTEELEDAVQLDGDDEEY